MARKRKVYLAAAVLVSLIGIPACFGPSNSGQTPGNPAGTTTTQTVDSWGSIEVKLQLPERSVQSVADVIDKIDFTVTGPKISNSISTSITKAQIAGGSATATISQIPPGDATLTVYVKDDKGNVIATNTAAVTVIAGKQAAATLDVSVPLFGSIATAISVTGSGTDAGSTIVPHEAFPEGTGFGVLQVGSAYVGATTCKACHPAVFAAFKDTAHWNPRENPGLATETRPGTDTENHSGFLEKSGGTYLKGSCIGCHTVGVTSATDSIKLASGLPAGFDTSKPATDSYNIKFAGIQCESCHGPGGNHVAASGVTDRKNAIAKNLSWKQSCKVCHISGNMGAVWATGALEKDYNANGGGAKPHHPQDLIYSQGGGYTYGQTIPMSTHNTKLGQGCINCHASGNTAVDKHNIYMKGSLDKHIGSCRTCHGSNFTATNVASFQSQTKMAIHTLEAVMKDYKSKFCLEVDAGSTNSTASADIQNLAYACSKWDDTPSAITDATKSAGTSYITSSSTTWSPHQTAYNRAYWNWDLIEADKSWGIHSPVYVQTLLKLTNNDLVNKMVEASASTEFSVLNLKR